MAEICPLAQEWLTLGFIPGLGCALTNKLIQYFGSPAEVLQAGDKLQQVAGVGPELCRRLSDTSCVDAAKKRAAAELHLLTQKNISLFSLQCSNYPASLRTIQEPPLLLYCKGDLSIFKAPAVAIVGSRAATEYGKRVSLLLARGLSDHGVTIVSGGAYGIDAAAHQGALQVGGKTAAILGCGIDVTYPKSHQKLFAEIAEHGALLSEYPLASKPEGFRFPARNRIISGLAICVIIVEATEKSGSLITARLALDQGRDVFAVPGRIDSVKSSGCHRLIQQGAHLVQGVDDILVELQLLDAGSGFAKTTQQKKGGMESEAEQVLMSFLDVYPVDIDTLARVSGLTTNEIHMLLLQLELKGLVRQLPGQQYEKNV